MGGKAFRGKNTLGGLLLPGTAVACPAHRSAILSTAGVFITTAQFLVNKMRGLADFAAGNMNSSYVDGVGGM